MNKKELQQEVDRLNEENKILSDKNTVYKEGLYFYANPLNQYDGGKIASEILKSSSKKYKSTNDVIRRIFKEKAPYPFVDLEGYIDSRIEQDNW